MTLLKELLKALAVDQSPAAIQDYLYDLAARERGEVSGNITEYIMTQTELRKLIRLAQQKKRYRGIVAEMHQQTAITELTRAKC